MDLFTLARDHDLPPRWDGHAVIWEPWEDHDGTIFICPPPRTPNNCRACGSLQQARLAFGLRAADPAITHEQILKGQRRVDTALALKQSSRAPRLLAGRALVAFRCPDCLHDQVLDRDTGELWDLDPTDYSDAGSTDARRQEIRK